MATEIKVRPQSKSEIRTYYVDFTDDLPEGVTVASATATHTPPSGSADTPTVSVSSPVVTAQLGPLSVTGTHILSVLATLSSGDISEMRLIIPVNY